MARILLCIVLLFSLRASADTYQIVGLGIDNTQFFGMDDSGHTVFFASWYSCGGSDGCYVDFLNGQLVAKTSSAPQYSYTHVAAPCVSTPCRITNNGRTAEITDQGLSVLTGSDSPQVLATFHGLGGIFALSGSGNIIFDNENVDEWYEAILMPTATVSFARAVAVAPMPEPSSLLLLATGLATLFRLKGSA